jgi:hypothetical protein
MVHTASSLSKKGRIKLYPKLRAKNRNEAEDRPIVGRDRCPICLEVFTYTPQLDHCHYTGRTRRYLCIGCNTGLGKFYDDSSLLRRCADYIDRYDPQKIADRREARLQALAETEARLQAEANEKKALAEAAQNLKKNDWPDDFKDWISDDAFWTKLI